MIKNVIFDMGNVMIYFDRDLFLDRIDVHGEDRSTLMREVFLSAEWAMMDRGSLTEKEAAERICKRVPEYLHEKVHLLVDQWERPIAPVPGMAELAEELKNNGYQVFLLSNASVRQHVYWRDCPGSEFFDDTLISADVHLVKPQPEIYLLALLQFKIKAEESLFIDDSAINVEGSIYSGIPALVFYNDSKRLRNELRSYGINVRAE